jgi:hypothetical protein
MKQIKQTLSEELNKMKYMLGYQRGMVISEQTPSIPGVPAQQEETTPKQKEALAAGWGPVTDEYAKTLPVGADGKILPKSTNTKLTIKQLIEKDIAKEKLGMTWAQVKERFGSNSQGPDNQLLWKAWKAGWRPGKEVPEQFQTQTYKSNNTKMASIDAKPIGSVAAATNNNTQANTQITPLVQQNSDIKTPEDATKAVEAAKQQAKLAKQQKKVTTEMCRIVGRAINPVLPLKQGVANQELCDTLRQCMKDGMLVRDNSAFDACKAFPETPIVPEGGENIA